MITLVKETFKKIKRARNIEDLEKIITDSPELLKNKMDDKNYPKLNFKITKDEIKGLKEKGIINDDNTFSAIISSKELEPLTKLLYAVCWKNGDLVKVKHIIEGIINVDETDDKNNGLVFYQFGKYLTKTIGEPIIDQHVIRAFGVYKDETKFNEFHDLSSVTKKEKALIDDYKKWLVSSEISTELKRFENYTYYIDKVLFALGKSIKKKRH